jgi:hypothetical protein
MQYLPDYQMSYAAMKLLLRRSETLGARSVEGQIESSGQS